MDTKVILLAIAAAALALKAGVSASTALETSEGFAQDDYTPFPLIDAETGDDIMHHEEATYQPADLNVVQSLFSTGDTTMGAPWKVNQYPVFAETIRETEYLYGIPADLLARVIYQESRYNPDVINGARRSRVGAVGIAQFMPDTAREYGLMEPDRRTDPYASINAAGRYLMNLFSQLNSWKLAVMAYNWGPGNVRKWLAGGRTPPAETRDYIAKISADILAAQA